MEFQWRDWHFTTIHTVKTVLCKKKRFIYKYSLLFVLINQCMPCFALITVIIERNEDTVMKDLIVIQNIDM